MLILPIRVYEPTLNTNLELFLQATARLGTTNAGKKKRSCEEISDEVSKKAKCGGSTLSPEKVIISTKQKNLRIDYRCMLKEYISFDMNLGFKINVNLFQ